MALAEVTREKLSTDVFGVMDNRRLFAESAPYGRRRRKYTCSEPAPSLVVGKIHIRDPKLVLDSTEERRPVLVTIFASQSMLCFGHGELGRQNVIIVGCGKPAQMAKDRTD
jgi:hypothetical protein